MSEARTPLEAFRLVEHEGRLYHLRFSTVQRVQHIILFVCFFLLIATGMPLLFSETWLVRKMFWFEGSFTIRGIIHRAAAVGLFCISVYHVFYCLFSTRGHQDLRQMILSKKDLVDPLLILLYNLGRRPEPPRYGRFNFIEKFEYYAVVWGSGVMLATGAALWFPVQATMLFPRWVLDIIRVIHGFEAILAFLAIIIWHMYNVHLNPEVFPMSKVWLNGRMDLEFFSHHHRLEFDRLVDNLPAGLLERVRSQLNDPELGKRTE
ncbi:MAG: cytochrome b/b6 domain-containing protein [Candidatus Glassbacteria bacterium]|nr:cytochrome b/b6 domain-containing protein [Candidatus Glassbacteria bacterium]